MKHLKRNSFIILLITLFVLFLVLKDNFKTVISTITTMDMKFVIIAIVLYFAYLFFHALVNYLWVNEKEKLSLKDAFQHMIITQFFNGITPFSTGGQPMEIYMLKNHGFRYTKATNVIMQNFIVYQLALVIFGLFAVIYNFITGVVVYKSVLTSLIILGFLINTIVAVVMLLIATSQKFTNTLLNLITSLGKKLHFIKNQDKFLEKWRGRLEDFHQCTKEVKEKKGLFVLGIVLNLIALTCYYAIPLFLVYSLHDYTSMSFFTSLVASAYVLIIGSFVPIPGATGGIEYAFLEIFSGFLGKSSVSAVMIVWRFITYYLGMVVGGVLFSFHKEGEK